MINVVRQITKYIKLSNVLPLVCLLKVVAVLVDALGDPAGLENRLAARASGGPPRVESNYSGDQHEHEPIALVLLARTNSRQWPSLRWVDERD